jgi:large subunit ribosomal protein L15
MKLHDLRPAPGAHTPKRRVGRGIAAGQGKTAGRGTKGQKARAGGTIPAWFEGGQTPLHQRLPKLHGFRNPFRIEYEVVNVGDIARLVELGVLEPGDMPARAGGKSASKAAKADAPVTVNQEILRAAGLVRTLDRPLKVLGGGELSTALFVLADAFSGSARSKIEAAGGTASVIESELTKRRRPAAEAAAAPASAAEAEPETEAETEPAAASAAAARVAAGSAATPSAATPSAPSEAPPQASSPKGKAKAPAAPGTGAEAETAAPKASRRRKAEPSESDETSAAAVPEATAVDTAPALSAADAAPQAVAGDTAAEASDSADEADASSGEAG